MQRRLLCVLCLGLLTACEKGTSIDNWLEPENAIKQVEDADVPTMTSTLEKSALDALEEGNTARAAQFYQQLMDKEKISAAERQRFTLGMADAKRRGGELDEALELYEKVLKNAPAQLDALEGKGLTLMAMGKVEDAGRAFRSVMEKDAKRWRTLNALGILFTLRDMVPEGMAYYAEALKVSADNPAVLNNVGLAQATRRNFPRAIAAMEQAIRVARTDPRKPQIEMNLALIYGIKGDLDAARTIARKYLKGPGLDNNMGLYADLANNQELAKTYLNQALTGATTYYDRAWQNLEIISESGKSSAAPGGKSVKIP